mmetsp:Transcript_13005/g.43757  ORF Transcript_13005/g.43757 Transcript_13005/m.43757 type:complete len:275 (-) Transcript_13005:303-1127(-)
MRGRQEAGEGGGSSSFSGDGACSRCDGSHAATASAAPTSGPVGACSAAKLSRSSNVSSSPLPPRAVSRSGSADEATGGGDSREAAAWRCSSGGLGSGKCSGACTSDTWQHSTPCMKRDTPARRATRRARRTRGWCALERCKSAAKLANSSRPSVPPPSRSYLASTPAASLSSVRSPSSVSALRISRTSSPPEPSLSNELKAACTVPSGSRTPKSAADTAACGKPPPPSRGRVAPPPPIVSPNVSASGGRLSCSVAGHVASIWTWPSSRIWAARL